MRRRDLRGSPVTASVARRADRRRRRDQRQRPVGRPAGQVRRPAEHDGLRAQPPVRLRGPRVRVRPERHRRPAVHEERQRLRRRVLRRRQPDRPRGSVPGGQSPATGEWVSKFDFGREVFFLR